MGDKFKEKEKARIRDEWKLKQHRIPLPADAKARIDKLIRDSVALQDEAEALGDDRKFDRDSKLKQASALRIEVDEVSKAERRKAVDNAEKEEVCDVCATTYLGKTAYDSHLKSSVHELLVKVRETLTTLLEKQLEKKKYANDEERDKRQKKKEEERDNNTTVEDRGN